MRSRSIPAAAMPDSASPSVWSAERYASRTSSTKTSDTRPSETLTTRTWCSEYSVSGAVAHERSEIVDILLGEHLLIDRPREAER